MSDGSNFGFAKLVPGFDFLQNLAKGASQSIPQMPNLASWVAPTLNVEELEKRIAELKAVQFWLDQNGKALGATIQALEVQKMTLATLQGMNLSMGELANALKVNAVDAMASGAKKMSEATGAAADKVSGAAEKVASAAEKASGAAEAARKKAGSKTAKAGAAQAGNGAAAVDPLQWWGALTQQFQQIAADAMKDVAQKTAVDTARNMAAGAAKEAVKAATGMAKAAAGMAQGAGSTAAPAPGPAKKAAKKPPARKPRAKTTP